MTRTHVNISGRGHSLFDETHDDLLDYHKVGGTRMNCEKLYSPVTALEQLVWCMYKV